MRGWGLGGTDIFIKNAQNASTWSIRSGRYSRVAARPRQRAIHSRHFAALGFLLVFQGSEKDGEDEVSRRRLRGVVGGGGFRNPSGARVVFSFRFCRRNGRARRASERRVSYTPLVQRPLIWNTYTRGYSASLYSTRMQISSILDFLWMRRSGGWWLVLRGSHFPSLLRSFFPSLSSTSGIVARLEKIGLPLEYAYEGSWWQGSIVAPLTGLECLKCLAMLI